MSKKFFLVFEGVDGAGKSSLIRKINELTQVPYTHNDKNGSHDEGMVASYDYIEKMRNMDSCMIDRLVHTGEMVYAPIYRGYDGYDYMEDLEEKMLEEFDILMVYVTANKKIIKERLESRGEDYIDLEDIEKIKNNYEKFLSKTKIPYIRFDTSYSPLDMNVENLLWDITELNK